MHRHQTATKAEMGFRKLLKEYGIRSEAVSMMRQHHEGEHTAVICYPGDTAGDFINTIQGKGFTPVEVTRIHIGVPYMNYPPTVRVYVRWIVEEELLLDTLGIRKPHITGGDPNWCGTVDDGTVLGTPEATAAIAAAHRERSDPPAAGYDDWEHYYDTL